MRNYKGIYFFGLIGAGKTTCADFLSRRYYTHPMSEGTRLRQVAQRLFGRVDRDVLQLVGEGFREETGCQTIWLDLVLKDIETLESHSEQRNRVKGYTIDDVRHVCDAEKLDSMGWTSIRVTCKEKPRMERLEKRGRDIDLSLLDKPSEHLLDGYRAKYEVDNSDERFSTIMQLEAIMQDITGEAYPFRPEVTQ